MDLGDTWHVFKYVGDAPPLLAAPFDSLFMVILTLLFLKLFAFFLNQELRSNNMIFTKFMRLNDKSNLTGFVWNSGCLFSFIPFGSRPD